MNLCDTCRFNKNNYCKYFSTWLYNVDNCTAYKKIIKNPIRTQVKKRSIKQEKKLAKDLGAKRTPRSGADPTAPNDMVLGKYVIESKSTKYESISLKKEWLSQVKESPINLGKIPTLVIEFTKTNDKYVIMDEKDFKKIVKGNKK